MIMLYLIKFIVQANKEIESNPIMTFVQDFF